MVTKTFPYMIKASGLTDVGLVRENNEDAFILNPLRNLFLIADGMGGHAAGEIASENAITLFSQLMNTMSIQKGSIENTRNQLFKLFQKVNRKIHQMACNDENLKGMGTTLCCVYFHTNGFLLGHVGDSRIYLMRNNQLQQLTEDHSLVTELIELGELNHRQAREYSHKNIITKAIGTHLKLDPTVEINDVFPGDTILMCTDGLSDMLSNAEIKAILNNHTNLDLSAKALIEAANKKGGADNTTVILIRIDEDHEENLSGS